MSRGGVKIKRSVGRPRIHKVEPSIRTVRIPADVDDVYCRRSLKSGKSVHRLLIEAIKNGAESA